jgi:hypothetical protein
MSQEIDDLLEIKSEIISPKEKNKSQNLFKYCTIRVSIMAVITIIGFMIANQSSGYDSLGFLLIFGGVLGIFHVYLIFEAIYFLINQKITKAIINFVLILPAIIGIIIFLN